MSTFTLIFFHSGFFRGSLLKTPHAFRMNFSKTCRFRKIALLPNIQETYTKSRVIPLGQAWISKEARVPVRQIIWIFFFFSFCGEEDDFERQGDATIRAHNK